MAELYMARTCKWGVLRVVGGDVWNHSGDVLITPANNRLSGREGLDALIHKKAGQELTDVTRNICLDMRKINAPPCAVTKNVVTEPYQLATNFKHIIHVVGPDCRRPNQDEARRTLLPETYANLFATLAEMDVDSIISPPISMGIFAYPHREGARLTLEIILGLLDGEEDPRFDENGDRVRTGEKKKRRRKPRPKTDEVCNNFMEGKCRFGENCRHQHPDQEAQVE